MHVVKDTQTIDGQEISIYIEVSDEPTQKSPYPDQRSAKEAIKKVDELFGDGMSLIHNCATRVVGTIQNMGQATRPDEFEIQLAIKLSTEVGAILTKMGGEAQMLVSMKWVNDPKSLENTNPDPMQNPGVNQ
jgi:hypothetical protein